MKRLCIASIIMAVCASALVSSCTNTPKDNGKELAPLSEGEFRIIGQLPAERFDSACIYLVPMLGPHPRPVDSVFVGRDGSFCFEGNVEQMAVLRLGWRQRYGTQELLVVTEPGTINVTLDSISSGCGTPQNDSLQLLKERLAVYNNNVAVLRQKSRAGVIDTATFRVTFQEMRAEMGNYNYRLIKNLGNTTLARFIFRQMFSGSLTNEKREELNELLVDTTDYKLPQPGFRR